MRIKVFIERTQEEKEIVFHGETVGDLLKELGIPISEVVVVKNDEVVTEDEKIEEGDFIKIIDVVSGG